MEERQAPAGQHKLILNNRSKVSLNGITDILSFDVNEILIETEEDLPWSLDGEYEPGAPRVEIRNARQLLEMRV